jgi:hypothetical protein
MSTRTEEATTHLYERGSLKLAGLTLRQIAPFTDDL